MRRLAVGCQQVTNRCLMPLSGYLNGSVLYQSRRVISEHMKQTVLQFLPPDFWSINATGVASVLLTLALVWAYISMRNIQNEQSKIQRVQNQLMQRQTALMAADHQPRLNIKEIQGDSDKLGLLISNEGNGPADNIRSQCIVYKQEGEGDKADFRAGYRGTGTVISSALNPLSRRPTVGITGNSPPNTNRIGEGTIDEGEHSVLFKGVTKLRPFAAGADTYDAPFSEVMQRVSREWNGVEYIAVDIFLLYTDIIGQGHAISVETYAGISLHKNLNLEECINSGKKRDRIGDPITEDDTAAVVPLTPDNLEL